MSENPPFNALSTARSAYLRSAAHQPVGWQEWGEKAFERARLEDKPILLDIGAVWCHWCHVMDRESYENPDIAAFLNQNFVAIKVDRDERPDIDARYQMAVSALTGQGGWPLTAFLTSEGKPFYGGTYFPPEDYHGRPGLKRVLQGVAHHYRSSRGEIQNSAEQISTALAGLEDFGTAKQAASLAVVDAVIQNIGRMFDAKNGGFGSQPKFPHPNALDLLLDAHLETRQPWLLAMVTTTLDHMGQGGVYDQLGGGFHRYSVDERWVVPHFEKMSYDNAGLLASYARAFRMTGNPFYRNIAGGILTYVQEVLSSPQGGFFASQDADINLDDDGDYFTWTLAEIEAALDPASAQAVALHYHVEAQGEMHHNPAKNVLFVDQPVAAIAERMQRPASEVEALLARARAALLSERAKRPAPFIDRTLYTSWNGMMISAFLEAGRLLQLDAPRQLALKTLHLLMERAFDAKKGMFHSLLDGKPAIEGLLDDQVFTINALLDAWQQTGQFLYYERAQQLMEITLRRFWDDNAAGFFDTARDAALRLGSLAIPRKIFQDSPTPAANSVAAIALDRLARLAERPDYAEKAQATLDVFAAKAAEMGLYAATYAQAVVHHCRQRAEIVVAGAEKECQPLLQVAHSAIIPGLRVFYIPTHAVATRQLPPSLANTLPALAEGLSLPAALFCRGNICLPPVQTAAELQALVTPQASTQSA
jgi:uncharacterized protein YyaL (SSP411 family)